MRFYKNQRVVATLKDGSEEIGTILYQRMAPPDYAEAEAVSVWLESRSLWPRYNGTVLDASQVRPTD